MTLKNENKCLLQILDVIGLIRSVTGIHSAEKCLNAFELITIQEINANEKNSVKRTFALFLEE